MDKAAIEAFWATRSTKAHHTPTLLEQAGCDSESVADQIVTAIRSYIQGGINEQQMFAVLSSKKRIT